jgi:DNA-binding HxlR family transcriptional regulator
MRTYGQYCPVAKAAELLGDRWTVLIVREMSFGVSRFNELERCLPGISRSVLAQRLRHLERIGIVRREPHTDGRGHAYRLSEAGIALKPVLRSLGEWGARFAFGDPVPEELDPDLLMRWISRHVARDLLPERRTVAQFQLLRRTYWLVLEREEVSVCRQDPGFDTDVLVTADPATLYDVYLGRSSLSRAVAAGLVTLSGQASKVRAFPRWFTWSAYAPIVREARALSASGAR